MDRQINRQTDGVTELDRLINTQQMDIQIHTWTHMNGWTDRHFVGQNDKHTNEMERWTDTLIDMDV